MSRGIRRGKTVSFYLDNKVNDSLDKYVEDQIINKSKLIEKIIKEYLQEKGVIEK